jgi:hypothetical protein
MPMMRARSENPMMGTRRKIREISDHWESCVLPLAAESKRKYAITPTKMMPMIKGIQICAKIALLFITTLS